MATVPDGCAKPPQVINEDVLIARVACGQVADLARQSVGLEMLRLPTMAALSQTEICEEFQCHWF